MEKKRIFYYALFIFLVLLGILLCYKGYYYFKYSNDSSNEFYNDFRKGLKIKDTITLEKEEAEDYLTLENIKIDNEFETFILTAQSKYVSIYSMPIDEFANERNEPYFVISITDPMLKQIEKEDYFGVKEEFKDFVKNNNIKDDIDLIKTAIKYKDNINNIFTSVSNMKDNYVASVVLFWAMPSFDNITLIKGTYKGYILNSKDMKIVYLLENDKAYVLTFKGLEYFEEENIKHLLNTIIIGEEK